MAENVSSGGGVVIGLPEMEEEEELFEIDLKAFDEIPPPEYFWGSLVVAAGEALLANCLMPVSDLLTAIPVNSNMSYEVVPVVATSMLGCCQNLKGKVYIGLENSHFGAQYCFHR